MSIFACAIISAYLATGNARFRHTVDYTVVTFARANVFAVIVIVVTAIRATSVLLLLVSCVSALSALIVVISLFECHNAPPTYINIRTANRF